MSNDDDDEPGYEVLTHGRVREAAIEHAVACVEWFLLPSGCSNVEQVPPDKLLELIAVRRPAARHPGRRNLTRVRRCVDTGIRVVQVLSLTARVAALATLLSGGFGVPLGLLR